MFAETIVVACGLFVLSIILLKCLRINLRMFLWSDPGNLNGPRPLPIIGNILQLGEYQQVVDRVRMFTDFGKLVRFWILGDRLIFVGDADVISKISKENWPRAQEPSIKFIAKAAPNGIFTAETNQEWTFHRKQLRPFFSNVSLKSTQHLLDARARDFLKWCEAKAEAKEIVDLDDAFTRLTFDIICLLLLGRHFSALEREVESPFYSAFHDYIQLVHHNLVS